MTPQPICVPSADSSSSQRTPGPRTRSYARPRSERLPLCRVADVHPIDSPAESLACFEVDYERRVSQRTKSRVQKARSTSRRTETARLPAAALLVAPREMTGSETPVGIARTKPGAA